MAPVRHILRGAYLAPTSDKYKFEIGYFIKPLFDRNEGLGLDEPRQRGVWHVWQPHFQPLLLDCLTEDIFSHVGRVQTFEEFAAPQPPQLSRAWSLQIRGMVLARG